MNEHLRSYGERIRRTGGDREAADALAGQLAADAVSATEFFLMCGGDLLWHWYNTIYDHYENYDARPDRQATVGSAPRSVMLVDRAATVTTSKRDRPTHAGVIAQSSHRVPVVMRPPRLVGGKDWPLLSAPAPILPGKRKPLGEWTRVDWEANTDYMKRLGAGIGKRIMFNEWIIDKYKGRESFADVVRRVQQNHVHETPKLLRGCNEIARLPLPENQS